LTATCQITNRTAINATGRTSSIKAHQGFPFRALAPTALLVLDGLLDIAGK